MGICTTNVEDDSIVVVHRFDPETAKQVLMYKLMPDEATDIEIAGLPSAGGMIVSDIDWPRPPIWPHDLPLIRELLSKEESIHLLLGSREHWR